MNKINGSCLCGKVNVTINPKEKIFDACHCGMCRKWGGGPVFTVEGGDNFSIQGQEFVQVYESSAWAERGFCKNCGTHLYYHLKGTKFQNFHWGLFKDAENFKFHVQIFTDSKPSSYEFANKTKMMTEAEVLAKFGSGS